MPKKKEKQEAVETTINKEVEITTEQPTKTTTEHPTVPETEQSEQPETEQSVEPATESVDTLISDDEAVKETPLYYVNTIENEVLLRSEPSMLDMGNVSGIIKEGCKNKKTYGIVQECKGFGRIQGTDNWIYLKFTKKVTRIA